MWAADPGLLRRASVWRSVRQGRRYSTRDADRNLGSFRAKIRSADPALNSGSGRRCSRAY